MYCAIVECSQLKGFVPLHINGIVDIVVHCSLFQFSAVHSELLKGENSATGGRAKNVLSCAKFWEQKIGP